MKSLYKLVVAGLAAVLLTTGNIAAQTLPKISVEVGESSEPGDLSTTMQIVLLLTVLALAPSILIMVTSFIRISVVLSFLKQAMGSNQMPPGQLMAGLALILTFFIMSPVINKAYQEGIKPYLDKTLSKEEAFEKSVAPFRTFMLAQTREQDLALFVNIAKLEKPEKPEDIPLHVLIPGFVISELRTSFQIAFVIFIPFLVIDMVVASVLLSMGMMMLPPIIVSLPFKILLFVLVDGWYLLVKSLVESFHM
ncbi:MAG: flagellar type III secretion system pore protein FliP [candidate division Zixibacteria bacterium]|nr:flagellar type III secretion system pore protein FliP [candidate division Zixibacteria bacterium]MDD5425267.1 flagellar type III secretion system pore protein FliP [candidate division Zixibacteria bacterium]